MSDHTLPNSAIAANDSKSQVLLALGQLLEQCDDSDIPELIIQVKTKLARRNYALNAHQCRLLDLPTELLVSITELLLEPRASYQSRSKLWFTRSVLPLLQTCSQLRTQLQPLRSTPLDFFIATDHPWSVVMRAMKDWRLKGLHKLPTTIIVTTRSLQYKPSTAAALAAALECAIYGSLSKTPAVYIGLNMASGTLRPRYYVSHRRAEDMLVRPLSSRLPRGPSSGVSREEGRQVWEKARRQTRDEAP